jgi:hypothetical protein
MTLSGLKVVVLVCLQHLLLSDYTYTVSDFDWRESVSTFAMEVVFATDQDHEDLAD